MAAVNRLALPSILGELLGSAEAWHALSVEERLHVIRAIPVEGGVGSAQDQEKAEAALAGWRTLKALDGGSLPDPADIYHCREEELIAILLPPSSQYARAAESVPWVRRLNESWMLGRQLAEREPSTSYMATSLRRHPFGLLVKPFVLLGIQNLRDDVARDIANADDPPFGDDFVPRVFAPLLLNRLDDVCTRIAVLELHAARLAGLLQGRSSEARFEAFIRQLEDPEIAAAILRRSPVLARLTFTILENWRSSSRDFIRRLAADWPALRDQFAIPPLDQLDEVAVVGDLHSGGRAVLALRFLSGRRLIYKPRSVHAEAQFQVLLDWLCRRQDFPTLKRLQIVARPEYGWVEYVETRGCARYQLKDLYRGYGAALAVLRSLAATDCHFQNVVSCGPEPVVVDLEALFHSFPTADVGLLGSAEQAVLQSTDGSVLTVGLLPNRRWSGRSERSVDISVLGARADEWTSRKHVRWKDEGTDQMREVFEDTVPAEDSGVRRGDERALLEHIEDIVAGFTNAYKVLAASAIDLAAQDGPVAAFAELETRSVLRATGQYTYLVQTASYPSFLGDAVELDKRFDQLLATGPHGRNRVIVESERRDLWRLDVPIFHTRPASQDIVSSSGATLAAHLAETGLERAHRRLRGMSDADLQQQLWLIRLSIATWAINRGHASELGDKAPLSLTPAPTDNAVLFAHRLTRRLSDLAIRSDGEATWLGTQYRPSDNTWVVDVVSPNVFDGLAGIAFALAYVATATTDGTVRNLAEEAFRTFDRQRRRWVSNPLPGMATGFSGIGGWIFALTHLAYLWHDDDLLQQAVELAPLLRQALDSAPTVDIVGGAAGAIRPLLSLYEITRAQAALDCALACGDRILTEAVPQSAGHGWMSPAGAVPLTGFAHGAAGIAWALLRLWGATREGKYLQGAEAGIAYERSLFSPRDRNWRDLRRPPQSTPLTIMPSGYFWCHGSAGIGLARLDTLHMHCDEQTLAEVAAALAATESYGFRRDHSLCHGFGSTAELFLLAERHGLRRASGTSPMWWGEAMLAHMRLNGCTTGCALGIEVPGLLMGLAGIAYSLLRLSDPETFPSVLLLEPPRGSMPRPAMAQD